MRRIVALLAFLLIAVQAVAPIHSYDFFWHLATGRWIVEHHALPTTDPFALAASNDRWINGEWLWEIGAYAAHSIDGLKGISYINAIFVGLLFATAFWFSSRERDIGTAAFATAVAFAGGGLLLGVRPAAMAAMLIVLAIGILDRRGRLSSTVVLYVLVTIVWINVHPSALLAPLIAATTLIADRRRWRIPIASLAALLVNPFGWRAIAAPVQLTQLIGTGEFLNAEWLPSTPDVFPVLYATIVGVVVLYLFSPPKREDWWRVIVFAGLTILAVKHVRNQGLYFAPLPLLIPRIQLKRQASYMLAALAIFPIAVYRADRRAGVDDERFPVRAVARLKALGLKGNIYNVDQFGGYLEWTFYPERRVLTDGRNELFRDFIALDAKARQDSRVWHEMQERYDFNLAVEEYGKERVRVVDVATNEARFLPPSLVRYRRRDWALVSFDDATMIFARRSAFPQDLIDKIEYRYIVPDDPFIGYLTPEFRDGARRDIERAKREIGDIGVVRQLAEGAAN